jgi:arylsulfatase A-like enzyme
MHRNLKRMGIMGIANEKLGKHKPAGPLRAGKYSLVNGGTRRLLALSWPARVKPGVSDALVSQVDFLASFAALANQTLAAQDAPDSLNVLPALLCESKTGRDHIIEHANNLALREGDWKFIPPGQCRDELGPWKSVKIPAPRLLFNLADDLAETRDLAAQHPDRVKAMSARQEKLREAGRSRGM